MKPFVVVIVPIQLPIVLGKISNQPFALGTSIFTKSKKTIGFTTFKSHMSIANGSIHKKYINFAVKFPALNLNGVYSASLISSSAASINYCS